MSTHKNTGSFYRRNRRKSSIKDSTEEKMWNQENNSYEGRDPVMDECDVLQVKFDRQEEFDGERLTRKRRVSKIPDIVYEITEQNRQNQGQEYTRDIQQKRQILNIKGIFSNNPSIPPQLQIQPNPSKHLYPQPRAPKKLNPIQNPPKKQFLKIQSLSEYPQKYSKQVYPNSHYNLQNYNSKLQSNSIQKQQQKQQQQSHHKFVIQKQNNNYILPDNQDGCRNQQEIAVKSRRNCFMVKIGVFIGLFLGLVGVGIFLILNRLNPHHYNDPEIDPNPNPIHPIKPLKSANIIQRKFSQNQVYQLQYTILTEMQEFTVRVNYTCYFVVLGPKDNLTYFSAVLVKTSQQKIGENGTIQQLQKYQDPTIYQDILKYGDNMHKTDDIDTKNDTNNISSMTCQQIKQQMNDTNIVCQSLDLPVFEFSLLPNGKINQFTFPKNFEKQTLSLLRTFVKMFSPLLDKDLYEGKEGKSKEKKLGANRDDAGRGGNYYQENQQFTAHESDKQISLKNQGQVTSESDTHKTNQQSTQQNTFSKSGRLESGSLTSQTHFYGDDDDDDNFDNSTNSTNSTNQFNPQPTQLQTNFSSHQECKLKVIEQFMASKENVDKFKGILREYVKKNQTVTLDVQGLINFITNLQQSGISPGDVRLLLEADGSLSLISYDKQIKIFGTNIIGFKIAGFGYVKLNLNLYQDPQNQYKKIPKIFFDAGTILTLGNSNFPFSLVDFTKQLPPLTLKFTLGQIQTVMDVVKGGFIQDIIEIGQMIARGDFQGDFVEKIMDVAQIATNISDALGLEISKVSPAATLNKIYNTVTSLQQAYQTKGQSLLAPNNQLIGNLSLSVFSYVNKTYQKALQIFQQTKSLLSTIQTNGLNYLTQMKQTFLSENITAITQTIQNLLPPELQQEYQQELQKAQPIISTIEYIQNNGGLYSDNLKYIFQEHQTNLLKLIQNIMDAYFSSQTNISDTFSGNLNGYYQQQDKQISGFQGKIQSYLSNINQTVVNYFNGMGSVSQLRSGYQGTFNSFISNLDSYANGASSERDTGCCCRSKRKWTSFWTRDECVQRNDGQGYQQAQPSYWSATKNGNLLPYFNGIFSNTTSFINNLNSILNDNKKSITQKYTEITTSFSTLKNIPFPIGDITNAIQNNINQANQALSMVCCGATGNLRALISQLDQIKSFVSTFGSARSSILNSAESLLNSFNLDNYLNILTYSNINPGVTSFMQSFKTQLQNITQTFQQLNTLSTQISSQNYISNPNLSTQVFSLYSTLTTLLDQPCQLKQSSLQQISSIRQSYLTASNKLSPSTSSVFPNQLSQCKDFLNTAATSMLNIYEGIDFCSISSNFKEQIEQLFPDIGNFTVFLDLWGDFVKIRNQSLEEIGNIQREYSGVMGKFYQITTVGDFRELVGGLGSLAKNFSTVVYNISLDLSYLRLQAKQVNIFNVLPQSQLLQSLQQFQQSPFNLTSSSIYPQIKTLITQSLQAIDTLNFDIINVYVAGINIKQYFNTTLQQFKNGTLSIITKFKDICSAFLDLSATTTQNYLNNINNQFQQLPLIVNQTIFPNVTAGLLEIQNKFRLYRFNSQKFQRMFDDCMRVLIDVGTMLQKAQETVFGRLEYFVGEIVKLISKLQIASLNSLYQLASTIKQQFNQLIQTCKSILSQLLNYPQTVLQSFNNIFKFPQFLQSIKQQFNNQLLQINQTIVEQLQKTRNQLEKNSQFYGEFMNSDVAKSIEELMENGVKFDVGGIWGGGEVQGFLREIQEYVGEISGGVQEYLGKLGTARDQVKGVQNSVKNRISIIKMQYQTIKSKLGNLAQLIFRVLQADLGQVVMTSVKNISSEVDLIVTQDFASIGQIAKQNFNLTSVQQLVDNVVNLYSIVKDKKDQFIGLMEEVSEKIDNFLQSQLASKVSKLQEGILFIQSQSNLQNPIQNFTLYNKSLAQYRAPLLPFSQLIVTCIGTFQITLNIDFGLSAYLYVSLQQFRNITVATNFSAALIVDARFSYGIVHILQFGLFVRGNLLRAQIIPKLILGNIIPVQLVQAIATIPQLSNQNTITVDFRTDLALYAVQLQVGFSLTYIWIELIWTRIHFCINLLFTSFCISFEIPIGFKFVDKKKEWGWPVKGVTLAKTQLFDVRILEIRV